MAACPWPCSRLRGSFPSKQVEQVHTGFVSESGVSLADSKLGPQGRVEYLFPGARGRRCEEDGLNQQRSKQFAFTVTSQVSHLMMPQRYLRNVLVLQNATQVHIY